MNKKFNWLIFIGERPSHSKMEIKSKPAFFDALQISKQTSHPTMNRPYHSIPLDQSYVSIHIRENNSHFTYHKELLQLTEGDQQLSEAEVYDVFTNFAFVEDNKVAFLYLSRPIKNRPRKKKNPEVLMESKELEV